MLLSCVGAREGAQLSGSGRRHLDQPRRRPSTDCTQQSAGAGHQAESWVPGQVTCQVEPGHEWDRGMFLWASKASNIVLLTDNYCSRSEDIVTWNKFFLNSSILFCVVILFHSYRYFKWYISLEIVFYIYIYILNVY